MADQPDRIPPRKRITVADLVSGARLVLAPILLYLAWTGRPALFLVALACSLLSDAVDGFLARRLRQTTEMGARLDSWGDLITYATLPIGVAWLWPDLLRREAPFVIAIASGYAVPIAFGFIKFRRLTSYHTWGAKLSSVLLGCAVLLLLLGGPALPFRVAVVVFALAEIEEIAITATLPAWRADVRSLRHARRLRAGAHGTAAINRGR
jgi:CDP-diacylglycerol--glycerol-3-phosphate 3-phosphatidyltransferase